jgi:hypothetical protein
LAKRFKIARERMVSIGGETVVSVGRARVGHRGAWTGTNRNRRRNGGRPIKLKCGKIKLASFLKKIRYPLRENPGGVECVAPFSQVKLEAPDKRKSLWLCKNHCDWVREREAS